MHASTDRPPPDDVVDILLWRLATDVAANHQPHLAGRCGHPRCVGEAYPCPPARDAERALRTARRPAPAVRGQAAVPRPAPRPVWGWFHPSRRQVGHQVAGQTWTLPRRQPAAALRAA